LREMGMVVGMSEIPGDLPPAETLIEMMGQDKKVVDGELRFILARGIGDAFVTSDVTRDAVMSVLNDGLAGHI
jgi:3-dehydroquinate synthase